ncbi:methionyl-tRNA formyltransferase [Rhodovibrionaceae bacterium A322]
MTDHSTSPTPLSPSKKLRLAFMGTPDFAVPTLLALAKAGHEIVCVYSQPPRPAGRGQKERLSPVHAAAAEQGWTVRTPKSLKSDEAQQEFAELNLDAAVVVAYGLILPQAILEAPRLGCLNVHASLLPRWRGAAPLQRAILAGDAESGVTIMQMDIGLDTGDMLSDLRVPLTADTTGASLHDSLAEKGARLLVPTLSRLNAGEITARPQPEEGVTYAAKLEKSEARLDWSKSADALERQIRAFTPWPGSYFVIGKERIKVLEAELLSGQGSAGQVLDDQLTVACGEGALRLVTVQRAGKAPMKSDALLRGFAIPAGSVLPLPQPAPAAE